MLVPNIKNCTKNEAKVLSNVIKLQETSIVGFILLDLCSL